MNLQSCSPLRVSRVVYKRRSYWLDNDASLPFTIQFFHSIYKAKAVLTISKMKSANIIFAALFFIASLTPASTHNWLIQPPPYNRVFKTRTCEGRQCTDACPSKHSRGMANSQERPAATWERGQSVLVKWAKNNHHGGMIRVSLVPVDKMWDRAWHKKMTIMHSCWEIGEYNCPSGEDCGTDKSREAFSRTVIIPSVFPDGDYVFGYVWYGGLHFKRDRGHFPDYYSCSHIRIRGGTQLEGSYQPFFEPGDNSRRIVNGQCETSADEIGPCEHTGCPTTKSFYAIPKVFQNGRKPDPITPAVVAAGFSSSPVSVPVDEEIPQQDETSEDDETPLTQETSSDGPEDTPLPVVNEDRPEDTPLPVENEDRPEDTLVPVENEDVPQAQPSTDAQEDIGICTRSVCCLTSCGRCGGRGCSRRPGGGKNCCTGTIANANKLCSQGGPPCVLD